MPAAKRPRSPPPSAETALDAILGVPPPEEAVDEGSGLLDALAGAAGARIETRLAHLDVQALAATVTSDETAARKRADISALFGGSIGADVALGYIGRDAAMSMLAAACDSRNAHHRAGLIIGLVCLLEARTVSVAVAGGLTDPDAIAALLAALARRRGNILDFNPVSVANALRADLGDATLAPLQRSLRDRAPATPGGRGGAGRPGRGDARSPRGH